MVAWSLLPMTLVACSGSGHAVHETPTHRAVAIYSALLVAQLSYEPQLNGHVFVIPTPAGASEPLSRDVQTQVTTALRVRKIAISWGVPAPGDGVRVVTLPKLPIRGNGFTVGVTDSCGNTCGHGLHYVVRQRGPRWTATQTGGVAIS